MNDLTVSVVIPAFNASATIAFAIESVLRQSHPASEILVIDDGSEDDLSAELARFGQAVKLVRQPNGGAASARNTGVDCATGDLIAFLDADDYWEPSKLDRHLEVYRLHPDVGLTCSKYYYEFPETSERVLENLNGMLCDQTIRPRGHLAFEASKFAWTSTVLVPRKMLTTERFDSRLETAEDRHLWIRLICSAPMYCIGEPLATAVQVEGSLSRTYLERDYRNMLRVVRANRGLLGSRQMRRQEADVFARWAGTLLSKGQPSRALSPALRRLIRNPVTLRGWSTLAKAVLQSCFHARRKQT